MVLSNGSLPHSRALASAFVRVRICLHACFFWWCDRFDDAYFLEPQSVKPGSGATPVPSFASGGGGGSSGSGRVPGEALAAAKELAEKSAENARVVRVEAPSEADVHGGGAYLNGIDGADRDGSSKKGASCERRQAERRADCDEEVVHQADPGGGGAGAEERRDNGAFHKELELLIGDSRGDSGSGGQILAATDRACSKRPRKEEEERGDL